MRAFWVHLCEKASLAASDSREAWSVLASSNDFSRLANTTTSRNNGLKAKIVGYDAAEAKTLHFVKRRLYMKCFVSIGASVVLLAGGLGLAVAPSAAAAGGDAWFQTPMPSAEMWGPIAYGDGNFVALASESDATAFSPDGISWYAGGNATTVEDRFSGSLAYGGGRFVAVAENSTATMWSDDGGYTWNAGGPAPTADDWSGITYGNGRFVAVAGEDSNDANTVSMWSVDGTVWNAAPLAPLDPTTHGSSDYDSIAFGNGVFVAVGDSAITSADGTQWQTTDPLGIPGFADQIVFGNGRFIAEGAQMYWSTDGQTWQLTGSQSTDVMTFGAGRFVGFSGNASSWSSDGLVWNPGGTLPNDSVSTAAFGEDVFVYIPEDYSPNNQLTYSQAAGQPDIISVVGTLNDGQPIKWVNGGTYYAPFGSRINFQASSSSGGVINGPFGIWGTCVTNGQTLVINFAPNQTCIITVNAAGGNGFLPSIRQVKYYVVATKGKQQPILTPRASGKMASGQVVHLQTASQHRTSLGQLITWKITRGNEKFCVLKKGKGKAVSVQLKSRGTCTVVGTAPADFAGNGKPMKVKRTYKII